MTNSELEERINETFLSFTDAILYFPCLSALPKSIYINSYWHKIEGEKKALFTACKDRTYVDIVKGIYEDIMGFPLNDIWILNKNERKFMYNIINKQSTFQNRYKTWIPGSGYQ